MYRLLARASAIVDCAKLVVCKERTLLRSSLSGRLLEKLVV